jgi:glycolate oxidase FAD binding subunit
VDVTASASGLSEVDGPPALPGRHRWSMAPSELGALRSETAGSFVAQVGVGIVHRSVPQPRVAPPAAVRQLHDRIKQQFDPSSRLNPGLDPLSVGSVR